MKPTCTSTMLDALLKARTPVCIVSDCVGKDSDAELRLSMAVQGFLGMTPTMRHVNCENTMAFLMADSLTRCTRPGLVIGNIAPRNGAHHHKNGIPFSYFKTVSGHLVVSTAQPGAFASFKLLEEIPDDGVRVVNTVQALEIMVESGFLKQEFADDIASSQFRSLDFEPLLAAAVLLGIDIPAESVLRKDDIPDVRNKVAYHDRFRNVKLWIPERETASFTDGQTIRLEGDDGAAVLPFYRQLRNVPDDTEALIVGSSGPHGKHFCEIVINGGQAAHSQGYEVGKKIRIIA